MGTPNADFLTRHGFAFALGDVKRALDLPVDDALLERLAAEAAPHHARYRLRTSPARCPRTSSTRSATLVGSLITEAPMGDLDFEPEVFDATRIRADEKVFEASGRTKYTTVAIAPDGELVAYSELVVPSYDPEHVYQWGTLVAAGAPRPPARAGHQGAQPAPGARRRSPAGPLLFTYNAEVNDHMIAVNEQMGFRPVARLGEFQKKL